MWLCPLWKTVEEKKGEEMCGSGREDRGRKGGREGGRNGGRKRGKETIIEGSPAQSRHLTRRTMLSIYICVVCGATIHIYKSPLSHAGCTPSEKSDSTPSGMMIMRAVPMSRPALNVVVMRRTPCVEEEGGGVSEGQMKFCEGRARALTSTGNCIPEHD